MPPRIDFPRINAAALGCLESLLLTLFPAGRRDGNEFLIGGLHGAEGDSLKINLNRGVWCDFASGEKGSDPISLLAAIRGCKPSEAARELDSMLSAGGIAGNAPQAAPRSRAANDDWTALAHAPDDCAEPDLAHYRHGVPAASWTYRDLQGHRVGVICRFDLDNGEKEVLPITWCTHADGRASWRWKAFAKPRPLYGAELIAASTTPILIVEGEKTCDAARRLCPHLTCVTWAGGSKAVDLADWSVLTGRKVIIWPDNDAPGIQAALAIQSLLPRARIVQPPPSRKGWDLADAEAEGWATEQVRACIKASKAAPAPEVAPPPPEVREALANAMDAAIAYAVEEPPLPDGTAGLPTAPTEPDGPTAPAGERWPFRVLGHDDGRYFYLPDASQQIVSLGAPEHRHLPLLRLAAANWWETTFPGKQGCDWASAANALIQASHREGVFTPRKVRGRGVWLDAERIVFHAGDRLIVAGASHRIPDFTSRFIYEQGQALETIDAAPLPNAASARLIELCKLLCWKEPIFAQFLAGWCAIAPICGVLHWRSHIWLSGPSGTGKSWIMNEILNPLVGKVALHVQSATTEAGIRQALKSDALPVLFDEAEANDQRGQMRMAGILELARACSSDGEAIIAKGTAGGQGMRFKTRSCFAFASVGVSASLRADTSRITLLELRKVDGDAGHRQFAALKALWAETLAQPGYADGIRARSLSLAAVIQANARVFGQAVAARLGEQRVGDQLGALLAGAFSLTSSRAVDLAFATEWVSKQEWSEFETADSDRDESRALATLLEAHLKVETEARTFTRSVSELLQDALGLADGHILLEDRNIARAALQRHGIKATDTHVDVSDSHHYLKRVFADTPWAGKWGHQLARIRGCERIKTSRIDHELVRVTRLPLAVFRSAE